MQILMTPSRPAFTDPQPRREGRAVKESKKNSIPKSPILPVRSTPCKRNHGSYRCRARRRWYICQGTAYCKSTPGSVLAHRSIQVRRQADTQQPAILKCPLLSLKAIYSRSTESAEATASLVPSSHAKPELYSDAGGNSYQDLLQRPDVKAVIIALPIASQHTYVEAALASGKHVLAEKPIAKDVATGKALVDFYHKVKVENGCTFAVAENFRYMPMYLHASAEAKKLGRVTHFSVKVMSLLGPDSKYFMTWRKKPEYQGGFLLDGGVHFAAGTRLLLRGQESKPVSVRAYTDKIQDHLLPIDSVLAIVKLKSGASGVFQHSQGSTMSSYEYHVACERGSVKIEQNKVTVKPLDGEPVVEEFPGTSGVTEEVAAWAESIEKGELNEMQSPEEALRDVEFVEKMFRSGEQDGALLSYELQ